MKLDYNELDNLSKIYGDAFYLLDTNQFKNNFRELKDAFSKYYKNFNIAYSYKTNYIPRLCKIINELGGYAEVVSDMEAEIALRLGVLPSKIILNGPYKNLQKTKELLFMGCTVNLDTYEEAEYVRRIARDNPDKILNVGVRCNFDVGDGVVSRFGIDVDGDEFVRVFELIKSQKNLHLINLQCHFAKRNVEFWPKRAEGMADVAKKVAKIIGRVPERIDIGGGLYGKMKDSLKKQFPFDIPNYSDYAVAAAKVFAERFKDEQPELLIEPGSALVGDCMQFVGKIESIKSVRGKTFVTMLGSQKNISMSGVNPPIEIIKSKKSGIRYSNADIVGYTCIEGDVIFRGYSGSLSVGDFVVISNCGSYSVVMKPPFILPNFPVLDIGGEKGIELVKHGECFDDLFHTFVF